MSIPGTILGKPVTSIDAPAFYGPGPIRVTIRNGAGWQDRDNGMRDGLLI